ncbi:putative O-linked N-acetylglucosamine transferase (SPINDLY family) [Nitrospirillum amazonense]|uniref:protein O-GlcNAc transferase n=1 Tax=Nitrospirillum amazonense TaxID=28077 RepID=A0A560KHU9_9PROT|nr:tetratricopeptide repeat protein [Nitrospirillum amazonense]TWB82861.1 putative O-linked N-acetylglucosamine transferase (SPINDLY family) [Nitrospirillum amazonense]
MTPLHQAVARHQAGALDEAADLYAQVLAAEPHHPDALHLLGVLRGQQGDPAAGEGLVARAAALRPDAEILTNLGRLRAALGRLPAAEAAFRAALARDDSHAGAAFALGTLLLNLNRPGEALAPLERAAALDPAHGAAHANLGVALHRMGRLVEAEGVLRAAVEADPTQAIARFNLASVLEDLGQLDVAEMEYRALTAQRPDMADAWLNLGILLQRRHRDVEARPCLQAALDRGTSRRAGTLAHLVHIDARLCRWDDVAARTSDLLAAVQAGDDSAPPFAVLCLDVDEAWHQRAARLHAATVARSAGAPLPPASLGPAGEPLRVGYLSADWHQHPTAYLMAGVLERHDRAAVAVTAFSYGPDDGSPMRARLRAGADRFVELRGLDDRAAAQAIRAAGVDILVDLKGYTEGGRPGIAQLRPAPVQVQYLGYPGTLGRGAGIDYVLADAVVLPPERTGFWDEAVVRLLGCYQANDGKRPIGPPTTRADWGLPADGVVFACFNAAYKLTPEVVACWARLLAKVPGSVLWLLDPGSAQPALQAMLSAEGVDPGRLVVAPALPKARMADHLARHACADLFLDTHPVNAHTTAADALYAGLPVLTRAGGPFISRVAASLLTALGLPDLVTYSLEAYEVAALSLARDSARLTNVRARLAAARTLPGGPFDTDTFCRRLEKVYARMAGRVRDRLPPLGFDVT